MKIKLSKGELRKLLCVVFLTLVRDNLFVKRPGPISFKLLILNKDSQIQNQAKCFLQTTVFQRPPLHIFTTATSRKRRLTEEETEETMSNSGSDLP